jgi:hypothetical protein
MDNHRFSAILEGDQIFKWERRAVIKKVRASSDDHLVRWWSSYRKINPQLWKSVNRNLRIRAQRRCLDSHIRSLGTKRRPAHTNVGWSG